MEDANHTLSDLFSQLGLPSSKSDIEGFVHGHRPLPAEVHLADASFWSPAQARFLREGITHDANWAEVVDQLNLMLRL